MFGVLLGGFMTDQMKLIVTRNRTGEVIKERIVNVKRTAKRIKCIDRAPHWFDLNGRDLTRVDYRIKHSFLYRLVEL